MSSRVVSPGPESATVASMSREARPCMQPIVVKTYFRVSLMANCGFFSGGGPTTSTMTVTIKTSTRLQFASLKR